MALHDGNGWVACRCGQAHWGRFGAAGLLLLDDAAPIGDSARRAHRALMQLRADWVHQGGLWALPGGARDSHEDVVAAALREAAEEVGAEPEHLTVLGQLDGVDHGDWSYTYVVARTTRPDHVTVRTAESEELRWVALDDVPQLPLHPALDAAWPELSRALARLT